MYVILSCSLIFCVLFLFLFIIFYTLVANYWLDLMNLFCLLVMTTGPLLRVSSYCPFLSVLPTFPMSTASFPAKHPCSHSTSVSISYFTFPHNTRPCHGAFSLACNLEPKCLTQFELLVYHVHCLPYIFQLQSIGCTKTDLYFLTGVSQVAGTVSTFLACPINIDTCMKKDTSSC